MSPTDGFTCLLLLVSLVSPATAEVTYSANYTAIVQKFTYQSKDLSFSDWMSLATLCLAPLIAHIVSGISPPICLSQRRPSWHERVGQYNPTTILWRYFAISDRRIRAKAWSAADMAASNADFWTSRGWDGSEAMIGKGRAYCIKLPSTSRATLLSSSSVKTLIVTLQGAQAIYTLIRGLKTGTYAYTISIDSIFFPLAVFGLLRLSAALWLTDDYHYAELEDLETITTSSLEASTSVSRLAPFLEVQSKASTGLLEFSDTSSGEYFHPTKSWRGVLYRFFFLLPILGLWTICSLYVLPWNIRRTFSATSFVLVLFYLFFLSATIIIFAFYFIGGRSATTIIPCITSIWYKIYTFVLLSFMLILVVIAALETRKTACGQYTTFAPSVDDEVLCPGFVPIISNSTILPFGLATFGPVGKDNETSTGGEIKVLNWDGWCQGTGQVIQIVVPVNTTIVN